MKPKPAEAFYGRNDQPGPGKVVKKVISTLSFRLKVYLKFYPICPGSRGFAETAP